MGMRLWSHCFNTSTGMEPGQFINHAPCDVCPDIDLSSVR